MKTVLFLASCLLIASAIKIQAYASVDPQKCIEEKCPNEWKACLADAKCQPALQDCQKKCGDKEACWKTCLAGKGDATAVKVAECGQKNHCLGSSLKDEKCIEEKCGNELLKCYLDSRCVQAYDDCDKECGETFSCYAPCLAKRGGQVAVDLFNCIVDNGCLDDLSAIKKVSLKDEKCIEDHCSDELVKCALDAKCVNAFDDCDNECGDTFSCWSPCLAKRGGQVAVDFWDCIVKNGCLDDLSAIKVARKSLNDPRQCIHDCCDAEGRACHDDRGCGRTLQFCQEHCHNDTHCWEECLDVMKNKNATDFMRCGANHHCWSDKPDTCSKAVVPNDFHDCIEHQCGTEWHQCQDDKACVAVLHDCEVDCRKSVSQDRCWRECLAKHENRKADTVMRCAVANDCFKPDVSTASVINALALITPEECIQEHCLKEVSDCVLADDCFEVIVECGFDCGDDIECWNSCVEKDAAAKAYWGCIVKWNCLDQAKKESTAVAVSDPRQCIEHYCYRERDACRKDKRCPYTIEHCNNKCKDREDANHCWEECLEVAKDDAAYKFLKCGVDHHCWDSLQTAVVLYVSDPEQCIKDKCPNQYAECQKDSKCLPALQDCQKKCGSKESCWKVCLAGKGDKAADKVAECGAKNHCI